MYNPALKNGLEPGTQFRISTEKVRILLDQAVEMMTSSKDPSHGLEHINNLLQETGRFFESTGNKFEINKEILLLALYWHDVWKSQIKPSWKNFLFLQLYEGLGSMFLFKKHARVAGLSPEITRTVSYAIRKHSIFQGLPARTLEAQLLWDMDTLDVWNSQRTRVVMRNLGAVNISIFDSYIRYMKKSGIHLYFEWTRNEVRKLAPLFFQEMSKFRESLIKAGNGQ